MSRSDLKYNWDNQIEQIMNETFKKFKILINFSSN